MEEEKKAEERGGGFKKFWIDWLNRNSLHNYEGYVITKSRKMMMRYNKRVDQASGSARLAKASASKFGVLGV